MGARKCNADGVGAAAPNLVGKPFHHDLGVRASFEPGIVV